jgi:hypothetical protein
MAPQSPWSGCEKIKVLLRNLIEYIAQARPNFDTELSRLWSGVGGIEQKEHFRMNNLNDPAATRSGSKRNAAIGLLKWYQFWFNLEII